MGSSNLIKQGQVGIAQQLGWDNNSILSSVPATASLAPYNASSPPTYDNTPSLESREVLGDASVTQQVERSYFDGEGNLKSLSFESYLNTGTLDDHFNATLQDRALVEGLGTYNPEDSVIDFQNNEGTVYAVTKKWAGGARISLANAIINDLAFNLDNTASGLAHLMTMAGTWVGTRSGNITNPTVSAVAGDSIINGDAGDKWYLTWNDGTSTYTDTCFYNWSMSITNNVEGECKGEGFYRNIRVRPTLTTTFLVPLTDSNYSAMTNSYSGVEMSFALRNYSGTGDPASSGQVQFKADKMICTATLDSDQNGYEAMSIQADILRPSTGWNGLIKYYA